MNKKADRTLWRDSSINYTLPGFNFLPQAYVLNSLTQGLGTKLYLKVEEY
jgi:hypothetical protein